MIKGFSTYFTFCLIELMFSSSVLFVPFLYLLSFIYIQINDQKKIKKLTKKNLFLQNYLTLARKIENISKNTKEVDNEKG